MRLRTWEAERLRNLIRNMNRRSAIYRILKEELLRAGHWKQRTRGRHVRRRG